MSTPAPKVRVAIIGGGMAGLCLAIGLSKYPHIDVNVYEAAHRFSEVGAGVALGPNAQRALRLISPEAEKAFTGLVTHNGWDEYRHTFMEYHIGEGPNAGTTIAAPRNESGQTTVHRAKFLDTFVKMIPEGVAHFGKRLERLEEIEDGKVVTMFFKDGTTAEADCVVGCDGVHSVVRHHLLGKEHKAADAIFTGAVAYRGLIPMQKAIETIGEKFAKNTFMWAGYGASMMIYPIDNGETMNVVGSNGQYKSWEGPWVQKADHAKLEETFKEFCPEVKKIVGLLLDNPDTMAWSMWDFPPAPTFHRGNVVMLGDAAHATVPFQGQGAGQGFEDAFVMESLLGLVDDKTKIAAALQAFDRIRRPRSIRMVETSREAMELCFLRLPGVEDDVKAFKHNIDWRMDWMWHRDIAGERDEATLIYNSILQGKDVYPFET